MQGGKRPPHQENVAFLRPIEAPVGTVSTLSPRGGGVCNSHGHRWEEVLLREEGKICKKKKINNEKGGCVELYWAAMGVAA